MVFMPHWPKNIGHTQPDDNLLRMKLILEKIDNPHLKLPPIIHITGTNGKGSTIAFIETILSSQGITSHCYTSPHLLHCNERIEIAGKLITDDFLYENLEQVRTAIKNDDITFFEAITAAAFLAFSKVSADVCIIECGMGARTDPTNVFPEILHAIITSVTLDHQEYLGPNIETIATEKSYIIKPKCNVTIAPQISTALEIIKNYALQQKAQTFIFQEDYDFDIDNNQLAYVDITKKLITYFPIPLQLIGNHQITNAATAINCIKNLDGFTISDENIAQGLIKAQWKGRLEQIKNQKINLPENCELWIDGAHNDAGSYAISEWVKQKPFQNNIIIYGRTTGKNHYTFLSHLLKTSEQIIAIKVQNESSPATTEEIKNSIFDTSKIIFLENLEEAISFCCKKYKNFRAVICGSLYLYRDLNKIN